MVCDQKDYSRAAARMRKTSWRRGDKTPTVMVKSWRRSTPSVDDCGFVAVSRWYAAWEILSRDKACPVECRDSIAGRARASRKIRRGRQNGHLGELVCALAIPRPPTHPLWPSVWGKREGGRGCRLPFAHPSRTCTRSSSFVTRLSGQRCLHSSAQKQPKILTH